LFGAAGLGAGHFCAASGARSAPEEQFSIDERPERAKNISAFITALYYGDVRRTGQN